MCNESSKIKLLSNVEVQFCFGKLCCCFK